MTIAHTEVAPGVTCIDVGYIRSGLACCYLLGDNGRYAFIDTGVGPAVEGMLALLDARGIARTQVDFVIPTHVHLDHAGGAGRLMQALPAATLVVHPRGARHLVDPSALIAGTVDVYGEARFRELYGEVLPIEEARVVVAEDEHRVRLGGRELRLLDAPGHARHHFVVWDDALKAFFSGDTFGISYRAFDQRGRAFLFPTTTPVQFEPEAWRQTVERMLSHAPSQVFLTHFGRVGDVATLGRELIEGLHDYEAIARECDGRADRHALLKARLLEHSLQRLEDKGLLRSSAEARELLGFDVELNAQGLAVWLDRQRRARGASGAASSAH